MEWNQERDPLVIDYGRERLEPLAAYPRREQRLIGNPNMAKKLQGQCF